VVLKKLPTDHNVPAQTTVPGLFDLYKSVKRDRGGSDWSVRGLAPPMCSGGPALSPPPETSALVTRWRWAPVLPAQLIAAATGLNQLLQAGSIERSYDQPSYIR
jgi:hypothetical protein